MLTFNIPLFSKKGGKKILFIYFHHMSICVWVCASK